MVNSRVLVLNQNYAPLNLCHARRAIVLLAKGKAEILENGAGVLRSPSCLFPLPSVIRLVYLIKRPHHQRKLTRHEVFNRDRYTCQYCGKETAALTLDHVVPRQRGGLHTWENLVSACIPCNRRKAGRTPQEAGMSLLRRPQPPPYTPFYLPYPYLQSHPQWQKFLYSQPIKS